MLTIKRLKDREPKEKYHKSKHMCPIQVVNRKWATLLFEIYLFLT